MNRKGVCPYCQEAFVLSYEDLATLRQDMSDGMFWYPHHCETKGENVWLKIEFRR